MDHGSKAKVASGVAWASISNWGSQILSFCVFAGLARLLTPQVFGLVAIGGVYVAFVQVLVTQGFGVAIIQRSELEDEHLDSALWIGVGTAAVFCIMSVLLAMPIAYIFHEPKVAPVIRWLSLTLIFYALGSVPMAILTRELDFRAIAVRNLAATGAGGVVGLVMACLGCGVWSLVGQQLVNAILACICLWWAVSWWPRFEISKRHLRDLYGFSLSIAGNDILWFFSAKSDQTLVGYGFGSMGLGPYSLAARVSTLLYEAIAGPFQSVALPAFSKLQSEPLKLERAVQKFCEIISFVGLPVFAGIAAVAPQVVPCLFGAKWASAVPLLQALALYGAARVVLAFMHPYMVAKGYPGLYLVMGITLSALTFVGCAMAIRWSTAAIAYSTVISMTVFGLIFLVVGKRYMGMMVRPLLKSFLFPAISSLVMLVGVIALRVFVARLFSPLPTLVICVAAGVLVYIAIALLVRPDLVRTIWDVLLQLSRRVVKPGAPVGAASAPEVSVVGSAVAPEP